MKKVFVDTDIVLDLLLARRPHYVHSAKLFTLLDEGKTKGFASSLMFSNLYYILRKQLGHKKTIEVLKKVKQQFTVLAVDEGIINLALKSKIKDFEDAVQCYTAKKNGIRFLITRNLKDYKNSSISAITAEEFLFKLKK